MRFLFIHKIPRVMRYSIAYSVYVITSCFFIILIILCYPTNQKGLLKNKCTLHVVHYFKKKQEVSTVYYFGSLKTKFFPLCSEGMVLLFGNSTSLPQTPIRTLLVGVGTNYRALQKTIQNRTSIYEPITTPRGVDQANLLSQTDGGI